MLVHFGIIPYMVFDGDYLPSKATTEAERASRREESKKKGLEYYKMNKPSQAHIELQKAVEVTPAMARELIEELKKAGLQYVVAPYEADAQLVYLEKKGIIEGMISEDSDLLVFGAKRLITKLDQYGECIEIDRQDFATCRGVSLVGWSDAEFRRMAILSGCDYLASISGMGLKNAYRLVRKYKTIEKILQILQFDGKFHVQPGYLDAFQRAELTFLHQRVFCPFHKNIVMMTEPDDVLQADQLHFIGPDIDQRLASGVARGDLDPMTKVPIIRLTSSGRTISHQTPTRFERSGGTLSHVKGNKSIERFLKTPRTPLAELDPNSFTPSPKQELLLEQASRTSWEPSHVARAPPTISAGPTYNSDRLSVTSKIAIDQPERADSIQPVALKKRRLLGDNEGNDEKLGSADQTNLQSPFFSTKLGETSCQIKSKKKQRRGKESEIKIWSDDSAEEIMARLPDPPDHSVATKVKDAKSPKQHRAKTRGEIIPLSRERTNEACTQVSGSGRVLASSVRCAGTNETVDEPADEHATTAQILDKHVSKELALLATTYPPGNEQNLSQGSTAQSTAGSCRSTLLETAPLQRLKFRALHRSQSYSNISSKPSNSDGVVEVGKGRGVVMHSSWAAPSLPLNRSIGPDASMNRGSEDFLIPDSEGDMNDENRQDAETSRIDRDFGQYAYAG